MHIVDAKGGQGLTVGKSIQFIIGDWRLEKKKRTITNLHKGA